MKSTLRSARKREDMLRVQDVALTLFEERGYDVVSVEEVAVVAGVGTATVYRWFQTKDALVGWDDFDPDLFAHTGAALDDGASVIDAVEGAVVAGLPDGAEQARVLRRARLLLSTPALATAGTAQRSAFRRALAQLFVAHGAADDDLDADVKATAVAGALDAAIGHWVKGKGRAPLPKMVKTAFTKLRAIA